MLWAQWFGATKMPRKKSPRKLHERTTKSKITGSLARPWAVVQDLRTLWNFGHQTCARGAKSIGPHDESPVRLAVQTRPQSDQLVKRAVFTQELFTCSAGDSIPKSWSVHFPKFPRLLHTFFWREGKVIKEGKLGTAERSKIHGHTVPWRTLMLICHLVTSRPLIFQQNEAVLSPCNFATSHLTACILKFYLRWASRPMKWRISGKEKVYTTTVEALLSFSRSDASMVYTLLSGPVVYTLLPCFPRRMAATRVTRWWCILFSPLRDVEDPLATGEAFLLTVGVFFLTVKLLCLQPLKAVIRHTFPL